MRYLEVEKEKFTVDFLQLLGGVSFSQLTFLKKKKWLQGVRALTRLCYVWRVDDSLSLTTEFTAPSFTQSTLAFAQFRNTVAFSSFHERFQIAVSLSLK